MCSFIPKTSNYSSIKEVPDPYYDDDKERRGFHRVRTPTLSILQLQSLLVLATCPVPGGTSFWSIFMFV